MAIRGDVVSIFLTALSLVCWVVMFLAGTDVWHDTGRHDFWRLAGPPYADLRAIAYAFYLLLAALVSSLFVQIGAALGARPARRA